MTAAGPVCGHDAYFNAAQLASFQAAQAVAIMSGFAAGRIPPPRAKLDADALLLALPDGAADRDVTKLITLARLAMQLVAQAASGDGLLREIAVELLARIDPMLRRCSKDLREAGKLS